MQVKFCLTPAPHLIHLNHGIHTGRVREPLQLRCSPLLCEGGSVQVQSLPMLTRARTRSPGSPPLYARSSSMEMGIAGTGTENSRESVAMAGWRVAACCTRAKVRSAESGSAELGSPAHFLRRVTPQEQRSKRMG